MKFRSVQCHLQPSQSCETIPLTKVFRLKGMVVVIPPHQPPLMNFKTFVFLKYYSFECKIMILLRHFHIVTIDIGKRSREKGRERRQTVGKPTQFIMLPCLHR
jgi:hypothetical protein